MTPKPPSARQLSYLRALAHRTGQSFAYPKTQRQASEEIRRLKAVRPSSRIEPYLEKFDLASEQAARAANCDAPVCIDSEVAGFGATATWSGRS
jgi:hypothetical protein